MHGDIAVLCLSRPDKHNALDQRRSPGPAAGWHSTPAGASDRRIELLILVAVEDLVSRSCAKCRTLGTPRSCPRRREDGRQNVNAPPSPNTPPRHQHLPPNREKCYPCVRYSPSPISQVGDITYLFRADCTASAYCAFCYLVKAWQRRIRPPTAPPRIFVIDEHACPRRNRPPSKP